MEFTTIVYIIMLFTISYFSFFHIILWFESKGKLKKAPLKNSQLPNVSIIVPAYNEEKIIGETLEKLMAINYPRNKYEVIIIDDGSKDNTYKIAKRFESENIRVLRKRNAGKSSALNSGIRHAKYKFIATVDADSFLDKNALRQCLAYFDEDDVAAVTSHILVKRRKTLWEKLQHIEYMVVSLGRKAQERVNVVSVTPGPLSVYRKDVLTKVGGFDEKNLIEDVEIAWRLLKRGYKIKMAFDAMVYSLYPDTFKLWWGQRKRWNVGGLQTLIKYFWSIFDRKSYGVGNFLVPLSLTGYSFSFIGISIFGYLLLTKLFNYLLYLMVALASGTNPFSRFEFTYNVDLLLIYGLMMFLLSLFFIRVSIQMHKDRPNLLILAIFLTVYPTLMIASVLISLYKFVRGERGWLTK